MKQKISKLLTFVLILFLAACTSVDPGHKGVKISWGGKTDMTKVYDEGLHSGGSWIFDHMVQYDCRQQTMVQDYEFNDKNNMLTGVEIALDYNLNPKQVNQLHKNIADLETKLEKSLKSAAKEVVPQYTSVDLNLTMRQEAETKLSTILSEELPELFCVFQRVQITDVDIPGSIAKMAEATAEQLEKNKLAEKMEAEKTAIAKATVAEAKGKFEAAQYDAKTKELLSRPAMLKLKQLEIEMKWAEKGVSPYGNNNVFGGNVVPLKMIGGSGK